MTQNGKHHGGRLVNAADPHLPRMPLDLENELYAEMLRVVELPQAWNAVDAAWRAILRAGYTVVPVRSMVRTRSDA